MKQKALEITEKLERMIYAAGYYFVSNVDSGEDEEFNKILAFATGYTIALQDVIEGSVDISVTPVDWLLEEEK